MKIIRDFWILTESGITVFNRVIDPRIDPQFFGALMSALNTYAEQLTNGGISNFELSKIRFIIIKSNNFLFVANSSSKIKLNKVLNELQDISAKFFKHYPDDVLKNWDGDINIFTDFEKVIEDSLEDATDKFQRAFW